MDTVIFLGFLLSQPRWAKKYGPRDHKVVMRILKNAGVDEVSHHDDGV